jgi:gas vesicle structural protein
MSEVSTTRSRGGYIDRPSTSSLIDVINIILDKGLVIDAFVRISVVGIELITIDARIVIASVDTYLRFAEATNRLDLEKTGGSTLPELTQDMAESGTKGKAKGVLQSAKEAIFGEDDKDRGSKNKTDDKERERTQELEELEEAEESEEPEEPEEVRQPRQRKPQERPRRRPVRKEQS